MRDFRDAKAMAQTLRDALSARSVALTHSESLELVAKLLGFRDWNVLSARIQSDIAPPTGSPAQGREESSALPVVPMRDIVFFPQMVSPIFIGREKTRRAVQRAATNRCPILAVTQRRSADDQITADALYGMGVTAEIVDITPLGDSTIRVIVKVLSRARIAQFVDGDFLAAEIAPVEETRRHEADAFSLKGTVLEKLKSYLNIDFSVSQVPYVRLQHIPQPGAFADAVASLLPIEISRRQELLETADVIERLEKILAIVAADRRAA